MLKGCAVTVDGVSGGTFELTLAYATPSENVRAELIVNGTSQIVAFPSTGSWNETQQVKESIKLKKEKNRIEIKGLGQGVNLDWLKVEPK